MSPAFPESSVVRTGDVLRGAPRRPAQMLADQEYDGHASVHDESVAGDLGLAGAPIEGPTHFSQFDPIAYELWGPRWFEQGCISAHFRTMVVEGETVVASAVVTGDGTARISAEKSGGDAGVAPVLSGTISIDPGAPTELDERLATVRERGPGELFIVDRVTVGERVALSDPVTVDAETPNGALYPFSLRQKLARITEPSPWYASDDNPWGRPVLPFEMFSVLTHRSGAGLDVRGPAVGLFLDLQVRALAGPVFVGRSYRLDREVLAVGQSRKVESHWVETTVRDTDTDEPVASVLLHSGVFKASFAGYPADRL